MEKTHQPIGGPITTTRVQRRSPLPSAAEVDAEIARKLDAWRSRSSSWARTAPPATSQGQKSTPK